MKKICILLVFTFLLIAFSLSYQASTDIGVSTNPTAFPSTPPYYFHNADEVLEFLPLPSVEKYNVLEPRKAMVDRMDLAYRKGFVAVRVPGGEYTMSLFFPNNTAMKWVYEYFDLSKEDLKYTPEKTDGIVRVRVFYPSAASLKKLENEGLSMRFLQEEMEFSWGLGREDNTIEQKEDVLFTADGKSYPIFVVHQSPKGSPLSSDIYAYLYYENCLLELCLNLPIAFTVNYTLSEIDYLEYFSLLSFQFMEPYYKGASVDSEGGSSLTPIGSTTATPAEPTPFPWLWVIVPAGVIIFCGALTAVLLIRKKRKQS